MKHSLVKFLNVMVAALLAGTSFGISLGLNPTNYTPSTYLEQQHHLVGALNTLMFLLVVIATASTLISAIMQVKNKPVFITLLIAAVLFLSCIFITRLGNIPIQTEMINWTVATLPDNWMMLRDKWWSFHIMRTVVELLALALIAWTLVQSKDFRELNKNEITKYL